MKLIGMSSISQIKEFLIAHYGFEDSGFLERPIVSMPDSTFRITLLYTPLKTKEEKLPSPHQQSALLSSLKEITCYIETGKLMHNAKRLAYMMCSGAFIWFSTREEFESANQWFKIAFQRSLTEFVFAEGHFGKETIYFFKGCPDITMREQL